MSENESSLKKRLFKRLGAFFTTCPGFWADLTHHKDIESLSWVINPEDLEPPAYSGAFTVAIYASLNQGPPDYFSFFHAGILLRVGDGSLLLIHYDHKCFGFIVEKWQPPDERKHNLYLCMKYRPQSIVHQHMMIRLSDYAAPRGKYLHYNPVTNNCQTFIHYVLTGKHESWSTSKGWSLLENIMLDAAEGYELL